MRLLRAHLKKLLTKISSWCLTKTKKEKKVGRRKIKKKNRKIMEKKRLAFILIKNLQIKNTRKRKEKQ